MIATYHVLPFGTMIFMTLVLLAINGLVFYFFDLLEQFYSSCYEQQMLAQQVKAYQEEFSLMQQGEQRIVALRHDMKNYLAVLTRLAEEGHIPQMEQYLQEFSEKLNQKQEYVRTGNPELDSILNYKLGQAERAGASLELSVLLPENLGIAPFDFNVILGNLLDNAIEGIGRSEKKKISMSLGLSMGVFHVCISNSYDGIVRRNKNGKGGEEGALCSRKQGAGHGLGLENVKRTLEKYHGELRITCGEELFVAEAMLYLE